MKYIFIVFAFTVILTEAAIAQPSRIKFYGYVQEVIPGIKAKRDITEPGGKSIKGKEEHMYHYYLYVTSLQSIVIKELWFKGEPYSFQTEVVKESPVSIPDPNIPNGRSITLVPKTTMKIIKISPLSKLQAGTGKTQEKARDKDLVLIYKLRGKISSVYLKKLTVLNPLSMQ